MLITQCVIKNGGVITECVINNFKKDQSDYKLCNQQIKKNEKRQNENANENQNKKEWLPAWNPNSE